MISTSIALTTIQIVTAVIMVLESEGAPDDNAAFLYDIEQTEGVLFAAVLDAGQ